MSDSDDKLLKQILSSAKYREQDKTRKTVLETIEHYKGLRPASDTFTFNNGSSRVLLALKGTIPITYKGSTYHIPVTIWLLDTYPFNAPMVFVSPTPDMRIKVSRHVDHNGKVYLPYLHDWKHNTSDLLCLIQVLIMTFGEQPPVYSVPAHMQGVMGQQPLGQPQTTPYPLGASPYPPQSTPYGAGAANPYPPYTGMPMPMPGMPQPQTQSPQPLQPSGTLSSFNFRPSLLSAAEEKLRRRLEDLTVSNEIIITTANQLKEGQSRLEAMMKRLGDERALLSQNVEACAKECAALDEKIAASSNEESKPDIDDAIQAPAPLYKQIVNTVAEEAALEDTIYYLGEALRGEQIDLEQYLRTVRQLSRRQFTQRAILRKCRSKAGFAG